MWIAITRGSLPAASPPAILSVEDFMSGTLLFQLQLQQYSTRCTELTEQFQSTIEINGSKNSHKLSYTPSLLRTNGNISYLYDGQRYLTTQTKRQIYNSARPTAKLPSVNVRPAASITLRNIVFWSLSPSIMVQ